jgi:hypothetical protein
MQEWCIYTLAFGVWKERVKNGSLSEKALRLSLEEMD